MKLIALSFLGLFLWCGCSKETASESPAAGARGSGDSKSHLSSPGSSPFKTTVAVSPKSKERAETKRQAKALFDARDYESLDALAAKYRKSQEGYASGDWRLEDLYTALGLPREASEAEWQDHLDSFREWIKANPDSITARVALADEQVSYAWKARGGGWASSVTEESWTRFHDRLREAVKILAEAKSLPEKCPQWHSVMLNAALGLQLDRTKYDQLFKEAASSHPGFNTYYNHRAYYLLPRWNGTEGEWEADLKQSADALDGETGNLLYARVVWQMHDSRLYKNILEETRISWPRVDQGFEIMVKAYPDSLSARSERAYLAALAKDYERARKYLDELEGKADLTVWRTRDNFEKVSSSVYAHANGRGQ